MDFLFAVPSHGFRNIMYYVEISAGNPSLENACGRNEFTQNRVIWLRTATKRVGPVTEIPGISSVQLSFLAQTLASAITPALAGAVAILHSLRVVWGGYKRRHHKSIFGSAMVPSEPPTQAGNLNSMPDYALLLSLGGEAIKTATQLGQPLSGVSANTNDFADLVGDLSEHSQKHWRRQSVLTHMADKVSVEVKWTFSPQLIARNLARPFPCLPLEGPQDPPTAGATVCCVRDPLTFGPSPGVTTSETHLRETRRTFEETGDPSQRLQKSPIR